MILGIGTSADRRSVYRSLSACASNRCPDGEDDQIRRPEAAGEVVVGARLCLALPGSITSHREPNPVVTALFVGRGTAALMACCDPTRFKNEAAFARCNGTAPIPASSGKTVRYRLNPGGDRQANNAIHTIAIIRAKHQPETRAYLERRIREGKTKREALRSLKRHISRELYHRLAAIPLTS